MGQLFAFVTEGEIKVVVDKAVPENSKRAMMPLTLGAGTSSQRRWLHSSVGQSVAPVSRGHGFKTPLKS